MSLLVPVSSFINVGSAQVTAYERVMSLIQRNESLIATAETEQDSTHLQQAIETSATRVIE